MLLPVTASLAPSRDCVAVMRVLSVVGARPQFVKLAPISHAFRDSGVDHIVVHTGQHYDEMMSDVFFRDLGIPSPNENLAVGSGKHGAQTAAMLEGLESSLEKYAPDWVLVYGDTNSTIAAALAAVKMHLPVAHLEAGLRSFNRQMPEEHNRVLTDHAADLLLAPTQLAMEHLEREGLAARSVLVGDVMTDVLFETLGRVGGSPLPDGLVAREYYVATLHRPVNTDDPVALHGVIQGLAALDKPVLLLAHPRLVACAHRQGISLTQGAISLQAPLAYPELVHLVSQAAGVVTDSGGLQKEAFLLRTPATTVRAETEWSETVASGWNELVSPRPDDIRASVLRSAPLPTDAAPYGDGHAAARVVEALYAQAR